MKIIFLDFDGVLNSQQYKESSRYEMGLPFGHSQIDPEAVERLNQIIDATGAKVVISSSWRHVWSRSEIIRMLQKRGFRYPGVVIGVTPSLLAQRGDEIEEWLGQEDEKARIGGQSVKNYVILDDTDQFDDDEKRNHMVHVNADIGLTDDDARSAISILGV